MRERPDGYLEAETFEEHMMPGVNWIEDPAYAAAFAELTGGSIMLNDVFTHAKYGSEGAAQIDIRRDTTGAFTITLRADKDDTGTSITLHEDVGYELFAHAQRLQVPKEPTDADEPAGADAAEAGEPADDRTAFPTSRDPLCQRPNPFEDDDHEDNRSDG